MSDELPSSNEVFESQKESLLEAWEHDDEQAKVVCVVMLKNLVRLAQHAVDENNRKT